MEFGERRAGSGSVYWCTCTSYVLEGEYLLIACGFWYGFGGGGTGGMAGGRGVDYVWLGDEEEEEMVVGE
jgi:hypothetical protein